MNHHWTINILFGLVVSEFLIATYCWIQWKRWENAYWLTRGPRDKELMKKTQVMPIYHAPYNKENYFD